MRTPFFFRKRGEFNEMKTRYTPRILGCILSWWEIEANTEEYMS